MSNYENYENYVIWSDQVWCMDEWESSGMSEKYDDVIRCRVNLDHPDHPSNKDGDGYSQFEKEMLNYWSKGIKPAYVV